MTYWSWPQRLSYGVQCVVDTEEAEYRPGTGPTVVLFDFNDGYFTWSVTRYTIRPGRYSNGDAKNQQSGLKIKSSEIQTNKTTSLRPVVVVDPMCIILVACGVCRYWRAKVLVRTRQRRLSFLMEGTFPITSIGSLIASTNGRLNATPNMDYLPGEITANIISHIAEDGRDNSLLQYTTVSRRWQQNIEAKTFAHVTLTPARLASPFTAQALTPNRVRRFVRCIEARLLLPPYNKEARGRREDANERREADALFTSFIRQMFALLAPSPGVPSTEVCGEGDGRQGQQPQQPKGVNTMTGYRPKIRLSLTARCASDTEDIMERQFATYRGASGDLFEARYESSYVDLLPAAGRSVQDEAEALPELACVSEVHAQGFSGPRSRAFAPRALCLIASRMSGLKAVDWGLCDKEKRDIALRTTLRTGRTNITISFPFSIAKLVPRFVLYRGYILWFLQSRIGTETPGKDFARKTALYPPTL